MKLPREMQRIILEYRIISDITTNEQGFILFLFELNNEPYCSNHLTRVRHFQEKNIHDVFETILSKKESFLLYRSWNNSSKEYPINCEDIAGMKWPTTETSDPTESAILFWKEEGVFEFFQHMHIYYESCSYRNLLVKTDPAVQFLSSLHRGNTLENINEEYRNLLSFSDENIYPTGFLEISNCCHPYGNIYFPFWNHVRTLKIKHSWNSPAYHDRLFWKCMKHDNYFRNPWNRLSLHGDREKFLFTDPDTFWKELKLTQDQGQIFGWCIIPLTFNVERILSVCGRTNETGIDRFI